MAVSDAAAPRADDPAAPKRAPAEAFDVVATYHRLLAEDPDLTKPVAAIEALIDVLRQTTSSTAMETYEITGAQVARLHAAVPNALPLEAGTSLFSNFLSMCMRPGPAPALSASLSASLSLSASSPHPLDSFDKIRQHLLDNSQLFVQRAKEARDAIAARGCRLVAAGDVVLTAGGSRAVRALLLRAAERLRRDAGEDPADAPSSSTSPPFTVLYVCDARARDESERAMAVLRARGGLAVHALDPSAVAWALEAHAVRAVFVGAEAVTHDGKLVSRIGTYQLALLARAVRPSPPFYALAETHKFVRKLLLGNGDLARIGIRQGFLGADGEGGGTAPTRAGRPVSAKPPLAFQEQVDVTPPSLITNIVTENGIMEPSGAYRVVSY